MMLDRMLPLLGGVAVMLLTSCELLPVILESPGDQSVEDGAQVELVTVRAAPARGADSYESDRRPGYVVLAFEGFSDENPDPLGRRGWWRDRTDNGFEMGQRGNQLTVRIPPVRGNGATTANNGIVDSVDMLLALLEEGYEKGYRRFIINRPAGFNRQLARGIRDLPNASWWAMDEALQDSLAADGSSAGKAGGLAWWIRSRPDATVGIYVGFRAGDPGSTLHEGRTLDADRQEDVDAVFTNLLPWAEVGVTEFWFDNVGGITQNEEGLGKQAATVWRLNAHPDLPRGVRMGGEHAIVTKLFESDRRTARQTGRLDEESAKLIPWFFEFQRIDFRGLDASRAWDLRGKGIEINVGFDQPGDRRAFTRDDIANYVDRGFTAWGWGASRIGIADEAVEMIRWVYFNHPTAPTLTPACPADIDMNGVIDARDRAIIEQAIRNPPDVVRPWNGDFDRSGFVDRRDLEHWDRVAAEAGYRGGAGVPCR